MRRRLVVWTACLTLVACGGGGSSEEAEPDQAAPTEVDTVDQPTQPPDDDEFSLNLDEIESDLTELPGQIRFGNFVSDGTAGIDIDVYWGSDPEIGVMMGTVAYGTVTDFMTPQHPTLIFGIDDNDAAYSFVRTGATTREDVIGSGDESFEVDSTITIAIAAVEPLPSSPDLNLSTQVFIEHELSTPPAGSAHVYGWDRPWAMVPDANFGVVGWTGACNPPQGEAVGGNAGVPALVPAGTAGLSLFDANTECASGPPPSADAGADGGSYVLIGLAPTTQAADRTVMLLPLGTS